MAIDTIDLETALKLLSLPRVVGADPADGVEITAQNGRYGPYLRKGADSRSLETEEQLFTVTLEQALAIYAQPKLRGRAAAGPKAPRAVRPVVARLPPLVPAVGGLRPRGWRCAGIHAGLRIRRGTRP